MNTMLNWEGKFKLTHPIKMWVAGSAPAPVTMQRFRDEIGIEPIATYGLTEVCGPVSLHKPDPAWSEKVREGVVPPQCIHQCADMMQEVIVPATTTTTTNNS
jgi:long-subunit acyl-CoA synthetase (AMP-forming)